MARSKGEGSIIKQGGRWLARFPIGRYPNGSTRYTAKRFDREREARDWIAQIRAQHEAGNLVADRKTTVADYLERWLAHIRDDVRPGTWVNFELDVRRHIAPHLGRLRLHELSTQHLSRWHRTLRETRAQGRKSTLSPKTVANAHATLRTALAWAVIHEIIPRNVATLVSPRHRRNASRSRPEVLRPDQLEAFDEAIAGQRFEHLYRLTLATGLRQGEVLALRWRDVDLERGTLMVQASVQRVPKTFRPADQQERRDAAAFLRPAAPKTERSNRTIALPRAAVDALRRQRAERPGTPEALVFANLAGGAQDGRYVTTELQRLTKAAGIERLTFHGLRHSAATFLAAAGVDMHRIRELLGHTRIGTTMDLYAHAVPDPQRTVANAMDEILSRRSS